MNTIEDLIIISSDTKNEVDQYRLKKIDTDLVNEFHLLLDGKGWNDHVQGDIVTKIIDTGDSIVVEFGTIKIELDYAQVHELRIMLDFLNKLGDNWSEQYFEKVEI